MTTTPTDPTPRFDSRTEANLSTLLPAARGRFRAFLADVNEVLAPHGLVAKVISGTRSYAEQNALYAQGRTASGQRVTNARGGYSNHNFGVAVDVGLFRGTSYLPESEWYARLGPVGKRHGLAWGGDWARFPDRPHYEYPTGLTLAQMRARVAAGKPILPNAPEHPRWTLYLNKTLLGDVLDPEGTPTFAVRAILNRVMGREVVDANLRYHAGVVAGDGVVSWGSETISEAGRLVGGAAVAPVADVVDWLQLKLTEDKTARRLTISRA